ncbi:MAG TPA: AAA family ATPase [Candidatus Scatovivens faecipullorum]|nr:AAA family ATPase [Candidatus Scatovivens faecipullorum]
MICSVCNKNTAVVFLNKIENGKKTVEGLCYNCAKEKGINPLEVLAKNANISNEELEDMSNQFENILKDFSENMNLEALGINSEDLDNLEMDDDSNPVKNIFGIFKASSPNDKNTSAENEANNSSNNKTVKVQKKPKNNKKKFLDTFGTNLTERAKNGLLDNVIGREQEIERMIQILNRRTKNNPCLIGEPGVGKTAIAQGLAIKIANQDVPAKLLNKEVYLLDMTAIIAGTQFRGQFEARMKSLVDECKTYGNIILVIDEIHNIIGAGDAEHSMNAANILKPSLSNGEIQLIGTTTLKEYRKYIEKDSALERRFQPVLVEEPSVSDTIEIIKGIKKYYEDYHKVTITNDIIEKTVKMSEKYIHDRFLPDKAIDLIDEACSKLNLKNKALFELELIKNELKKVADEKEEAVSSDSIEEYQKAADLKTKECNLTDRMNEIEKDLKPSILTVQDVAEVIERWTKIPVTKITEAETQKLLNLEKNLHKHVISQDEAVTAVAKAIRRNRAGLQSTKRPPSFIFVGPTGVGKTELAKALAYEMFGSEDSIIRIDMSEYMESHSTSKLIGSPPGYVGYDDAGQLTEKVKRRPYSIILLDEIEKAHSDVFNILLQVLDDGKLTDAQGNTVNFENTIIIMTSNAGSNLNNNSIGFASQSTIDSSKMLGALKELFRPEFLNRVDETIVFKPLTESELLQIVDLLLEKTQEALSNKEIHLDLSLEAKKFIVSKGTDLKYGARPLRRAIQKLVEDEIAEMILKDEIVSGQTVFINVENDALKFTV